ncbi:hypothetical protein ES705_11434 [subsurface metagenome]
MSRGREKKEGLIMSKGPEKREGLIMSRGPEKKEGLIMSRGPEKKEGLIMGRGPEKFVRVILRDARTGKERKCGTFRAPKPGKVTEWRLTESYSVKINWPMKK